MVSVVSMYRRFRGATCVLLVLVHQNGYVCLDSVQELLIINIKYFFNLLIDVRLSTREFVHYPLTDIIIEKILFHDFLEILKQKHQNCMKT